MSVINGVTVIEQLNFTPQKEIVRSGEMVNGLGQTIGDYVRLKYTLNFKWPALSAALLALLDAALDPETYPTFSVTHSTLSGDYTGTYKVTSPLQAERLLYNSTDGLYEWGNVTLTLGEV